MLREAGTHGLEHLIWKQIMLAASDRFMDRLVCRTAGRQRPVLVGDCVKAAYDLTAYLGISHALWAEACAVLGEALHNKLELGAKLLRLER